MDDRLVQRAPRRPRTQGVLQPHESTRGRRGRQLRSAPSRDQDTARGVEGRLAPLRGELLSAVSTGSSLPRSDRHLDLTRRIPLHRSPAAGETRDAAAPGAVMAVAGAIPEPEHHPLELSMRQTGLSFQRTRMSADRTLMSVIRTALSLIGFGFTVFQFFHHIEQAGTFGKLGQSQRNFGGSLVVLGIGMLVLGIGYHLQFMLGLRAEVRQLK